jgi:hypothetical protein
VLERVSNPNDEIDLVVKNNDPVVGSLMINDGSRIMATGIDLSARACEQGSISSMIFIMMKTGQSLDVRTLLIPVDGNSRNFENKWIIPRSAKGNCCAYEL